MNIEKVFDKIKNKIMGKDLQNPCPTPILLYIAAKWNYHSDVEPWYGYIKEQAGNVDKNSPEFHSAVVCGMLPQLQQAAAGFVKKAEEYLQQNRPSAEEWRKKEVKKRIIGGLKKN